MNRFTLLCVDDDPAVLSSLRRALKDEPYDVMTALSPREALDTLDHRPVDVVIADHRMPGMSGLDLLKEVRARSPGTARVMLTGHPDSEIIQERVSQGVERLITKPWDNGEVRALLSQLLDEKARGADAEKPAPRSAGRTGVPVVRVDCGGSDPHQVARVIRERLRAVPLRTERVIVVLKEVLALRGSVSGVFRALLHEVRSAGLRAYIVDPSRCAARFTEGVDSPCPLMAFEGEEEVAEFLSWIMPDEGSAALA